MARSSAPVDFAAERMEYADVAVDADRLRIGSLGEAMPAPLEDDDDDAEYFDSDLRIDRVFDDTDGNRTLFLVGTKGFTSTTGGGLTSSSGLMVSAGEGPLGTGEGVGIGRLSSSSVESAYANPPPSLLKSVSDDCGPAGAGVCEGGLVSIVGVAGRGTLGASRAGGSIRSPWRRE